MQSRAANFYAVKDGGDDADDDAEEDEGDSRDNDGGDADEDEDDGDSSDEDEGDAMEETDSEAGPSIRAIYISTFQLEFWISSTCANRSQI